jgi:hypothetical protein
MATVYGNGAAYVRRTSTWQDWCNLVLGMWLFISPWALQFGHGLQAPSNGGVAAAAWNAWIMGALIFIAAATALGSVALWQEWLALIFGAWVFIAPWALGFTSMSMTSWDHWIVGALTFLIAACSIATAYNRSEATRPSNVRGPLG